MEIKKLFGKVLAGVSATAFVLGIPLLTGYAISKSKETARLEREAHIRDKCMQEIKPEHSRGQLEDIILTENTPRDAFESVLRNINKFTKKDCERIYSMQESFSLGVGNCIDGVVNFVAMLSDNPEYKAEVILLDNGTKNDNHAIGIYQENGRWGYASFNDTRRRRNAFLKPATHLSKEGLIRWEFGNYYGFKQYGVLELELEKMKFGKVIVWEEEIKKVEWKPIEN